MSTKPTRKNKNGLLAIIYSAGFLFAFHLALLTYIESSFLATFIQERFVGTIYTIAAVITITILSNISKILDKLGNYVTFNTLLILEIGLLLSLVFVHNPILTIISFILHLSIITVMVFNLDIFLESNSSNESTGGTRGIYLTFYNAAWVIPPLIAGLVLTNGDYWKIFILASAFVLPVILILHSKFDDFIDPKYDKVPFWGTLKEIWHKRDIFRIFMSNFMLNFFFSWMVIYTPLYLHNHIGLDWGQIGIIFTVMLLPFVILEIPLGKLADLRWGEKELLVIGFVIMAVSTASLSFINSPSVWLWALILFLTRTGASIVLAMNETYFFKQINASNANIIGFFRNARPLAYIVSPIIATALLSFLEFRFLFLVLGFLMLWSLRYIYELKDTK